MPRGPATNSATRAGGAFIPGRLKPSWRAFVPRDEEIAIAASNPAGGAVRLQWGPTRYRDTLARPRELPLLLVECAAPWAGVASRRAGALRPRSIQEAEHDHDSAGAQFRAAVAAGEPHAQSREQRQPRAPRRHGKPAASARCTTRNELREHRLSHARALGNDRSIQNHARFPGNYLALGR